MASEATLWHHRDFMLLWAGQSVSRLGDQFTALALPYVAVTALRADAGQMGILGTLGTLPFLLFGLIVGVWVDRHRRRPVLILGDLGRGAIVGSIALLVFGGLLRMEILYILAFLTGTLTVFFDIAYQAYLPALVTRVQLVEGNSKLETTNTGAQFVGPSVAGVIIQVLSSAWAMVFDGLTFLYSGIMMMFIRAKETPPDPTQRRSAFSEAREGVAVVFGDIRLWSIAGCTGTSNFFGSIWFTLLVLYALDTLGMDAVALGLAFGLGSLGGVVGAVSGGPLAKRYGVGRCIVGSIIVGSLAGVVLLLAAPAFAFIALTATMALASYGAVVYNINQVSLRQALVPVRLQGRLNATMRFLVWGTIPLGSLAGGILGATLGLYWAMVVGIVGGLFTFLWVFLSPVRAIEDMPEPLA
jgi:MFS family permease